MNPMKIFGLFGTTFHKFLHAVKKISFLKVNLGLLYKLLVTQKILFTFFFFNFYIPARSYKQQNLIPESTNHVNGIPRFCSEQTHRQAIFGTQMCSIQLEKLDVCDALG